ncbi:MAG: hypothetical protein ACHRXM_22105 [Isosphaerales bacterium]
MLCNTVLLAQFGDLTSKDLVRFSEAIAAGLCLVLVFLGLCLLPILIWRGRLRKRGYPGIGAYLHELPQTEEQKLDAVDLTLKGAVLCGLGLLFPPLILIGLVPFYYGARKLMVTKLGITGAKEDVHDGRME